MSLILIYIEIPDIPPDLRPKRMAVFPVDVRVARERAVRLGIALTDGVASDRFVAFGNNVRGREGAKLRSALIEFIKKRQRHGPQIYMTLLFPKGRIGTVVLNPKAARSCPLGRLRTALKTFRPGQILEIASLRQRQERLRRTAQR